MPNENSKAVFDVETDGCIFTTWPNGDMIDLRNLHLGKEESANLAWLINHGSTLTVTVKIKD